MKSMIVLVTLIFAALFAVAQEHPAVTAQPNTVFVGGDGKFEANPDTALLQFNISAQADTSRASYEQASKDTEQVRQVLRANGIDPKMSQIGFFSVQPVYDYRNPKQKLIGYRVGASVSLKLKEFDKVAPILQQLADADTTENQSLSYTLEDMNSAKTKAIEDAYRRARESADALARASGRTLGELSYATVDVNENIGIISPMRVMGRVAMAAPSVPAPTEQFSPQTVQVNAHVNAVFGLK
jgi:uncharacterized protein YggE